MISNRIPASPSAKFCPPLPQPPSCQAKAGVGEGVTQSKSPQSVTSLGPPCCSPLAVSSTDPNGWSLSSLGLPTEHARAGTQLAMPLGPGAGEPRALYSCVHSRGHCPALTHSLSQGAEKAGFQTQEHPEKVVLGNSYTCENKLQTAPRVLFQAS